MILVTGGTGLVGSHLLYHLSLTSNDIIAIYRTKEKINKVKQVFSFYTDDIASFFSKIRWIKADITDTPSLSDVFCYSFTQVYHCAALVSFDSREYKKMRITNIEGTANVVNFCIAKKVQKLCYVSSIATIGDAINNNLITEENEWTESKDNSEYAITKFGAEMEVWRASQEGLDVVMVNPGIILGRGFLEEGSGKIVSHIKNGFKFYTSGIMGFVGVRDVVTVMIRLMLSEIKSERFILVAENKSFKEVFFAIADKCNVKRPSIKVGKFVTSVFWKIDWFISRLTGKTPILTKNMAKVAHSKEQYSSEKIKTYLSFDFEKTDAIISNF